MVPHGVMRKISAVFLPLPHLCLLLGRIILIASIVARITISGIAGGMAHLVDGVKSTISAAYSPRLQQRYLETLIISNVSIAAKTTRFGIVGGTVIGGKNTFWEGN